MSEFLLELFSEEIPARMQADAAAEVRFTNAASRIVNAPVQPVSAVPSAMGVCYVTQ